MSEREALRLEALRFGWDAADLVDIPELAIERGERVFIEGPSGCGKSTLLGLIGGVTVPRSGTVTVLGQEVSSLPSRRRDRFRADHIGFVFQLFNLVPYLSMTENVTLPLRFSPRRRARLSEEGRGVEAEAARLLEALGLTDGGLGERAVTGLSIGQQQRVAAARALIGRPEVLVADEPTSALDEGTRERFLALLMRECAAGGTTLILVSHDARLARLFDRRIELRSLNRASRATGAVPAAA